MGRTECNRIVNFPAGALAARLTGQLIDVRITEARAALAAWPARSRTAGRRVMTPTPAAVR